MIHKQQVWRQIFLLSIYFYFIIALFLEVYILSNLSISYFFRDSTRYS